MPPPKHRLLLTLVWLAFLLRGAFYSVELPIWEGFDEWAHFASVQHIAETGTLPKRTDPVSKEICESLRIFPLPAESARDHTGTLTHQAYWKLPPSERPRTGACPTPILNYQAQHPPLYYVLASIPYRLIRDTPLPTRVLVLRLLNVLIGSALVFVVYFAAREVLPPIAIPASILIASMPGLFITISRAGNESLTLVLCGLVLLTVLRGRHAGLALGAALLAKAYALAFIPLFLWRRQWKALAIALLIAGWWYVLTVATTGTFSGEQLDAKSPMSAKLAAVLEVNWLTALDSGTSTHVWTGAWSFLTVRRWMYRVFQLLFLVAAAGVILRGRTPKAATTAAMFLLMCAALAYQTTVMYVTHGISTALGWYLNAVIVAEAILLSVGLGPRAAGAAALLYCALDIYTINFVLIPFHTGGAQMFERLASMDAVGQPVIAGLWGAYVCATLALASLGLQHAFPSSRG